MKFRNRPRCGLYAWLTKARYRVARPRTALVSSLRASSTMAMRSSARALSSRQ